MKRLSIAALILSLSFGQTSADQAPSTRSPSEVAKAVKYLVEREFYRPVTYPAYEPDKVTSDDIDRALASFGTSHTARFKPGTIDFVELADILRHSIRHDLKRMFPPDGEPSYEGIGIITREVGDRQFVSDVYDGTPAAASGILTGDEIISVDGEPFREIGSFKGKIGRNVVLSIRRTAEASPIEVKTTVVRIRPIRTFSDAISKSMRLIDHDGLKLAYFHLWALGSGDIEQTITQALKNGQLKDADGLVVDLRGRWGGMFGEVPDLLMSNEPEVSFKGRDGKTSYASTTYAKPVVAIIDEGTRSAQEMFAALVRKRGVELVGMPTPGAVLATRAFVLPDDSLLILPISEVRIDGELLEGKGVKPDVQIDFWLPYAAGRDPQLEAAMSQMSKALCADPTHGAAAACKPDAVRAN